MPSTENLLDGATHTYANYSANCENFTDLRQPGAYVFTPTGGVTNDFKTFGADEPSTEPYWGAVLIRVSGEPSTALLRFEYVFHYEGTVDPVSGL